MGVTLLKPIAQATSRPKWSIMIPTYNCAHYLAETLQSVLCQVTHRTDVQIEVIDDASTDNVEEVIATHGQGKVKFFKQPYNVGHIKNFATALERSMGHYIHLLHGDDRVLWGFYAAMENELDRDEKIGAAFCRHYYINNEGDQMNISTLLTNSSGIWPHFYSEMLKGCLVQTPSIVVKRWVYEQIGMFDDRLIYTEDYEMWVRIGCHYPVAYHKKPLAEYRFHATSHTARTVQSGKAIADQLRLITVLSEKYPAAIAENKTLWYRNAGTYLRNEAKACISRKDVDGAFKNVKLAFRHQLIQYDYLRWLKLVLYSLLRRPY